MQKVKHEYYILRTKAGEDLEGEILKRATKEEALSMKEGFYNNSDLVVCKVQKTFYYLDNGRFFKEEAAITACP